jgi:L-ascorbate metabolism protein UlaG (beta-lactamase superfamily)
MSGSVKWLSHACFKITSTKGKIIYIDPFFVDNPLRPISLDDIKIANIILITHDHPDHVGDAVDIAENTGATIVAQPETVGRMMSDLGLSVERVVNFGTGMNIGATVLIDGIAITMTQASHSSQTASNSGFIVKLDDGYTIYHAGDTGIFATMKILGELYTLDLALLPIGGAFTMDSVQAARALTLLNPKKAIPMHYKTWPLLEQSADTFVDLAKKEAPGVEVVVLEPGQEIAI